MKELKTEILRRMAAIRLAEIDIKEGNKLFNFAVEIWVNGYLEAERDNEQRNDYTNMIEQKIKNLFDENPN